MKKFKRILFTVASMTMISTMVAGCGGSTTEKASDTTTADSESSDDKEVLTIAYADNTGLGEESYWYRYVNGTYENWEKKDEVELDLQPIVANNGDYFTKMQTQLQSETTTPDIFFEDTFQLNSDIAAGYIADLTDYVEGWDQWDTAIYDTVKEGVTGADGRIYGVPCSTDVRGIWYNKDIFEEAGLGREWQPESWQDILDACEAIKTNCSEDVIPYWCTLGAAASEGTTMETFEMFLYGTGETLYDEETGIWNIDTQGTEDTFTMLKTMKDSGYFGPLSEILDANPSAYGYQYFADGQLGMLMDGNWAGSTFLSTGQYPMKDHTDDELADVLGFAQMPNQYGDGYVTMSGGWCWSIAEKSDNKDLAFEFLQELLEPDNYITYVLGSGNLSVRNDMESYPDYANTLYLAESIEMIDSANYRPHNEVYPKVSSYISDAVDSLIRTDISVEDLMASYTENVASVVGEENMQ